MMVYPNVNILNIHFRFYDEDLISFINIHFGVSP
jgi:hypothetical protein